MSFLLKTPAGGAGEHRRALRLLGPGAGSGARTLFTVPHPIGRCGLRACWVLASEPLARQDTTPAPPGTGLLVWK